MNRSTKGMDPRSPCHRLGGRGRGRRGPKVDSGGGGAETSGGALRPCRPWGNTGDGGDGLSINSLTHDGWSLCITRWGFKSYHLQPSLSPAIYNGLRMTQLFVSICILAAICGYIFFFAGYYIAVSRTPGTKCSSGDLKHFPSRNGILAYEDIQEWLLMYAMN
jgi:hypothetical protein